MHSNPFTDEELNQRLKKTKTLMESNNLDLIILSAPENIFYLTGLDHWGYFAPTALIVSLKDSPVLITREMERVVIRNQVRNANFVGHSDTETAADVVEKYLKGKTSGKSIGVEEWSSGLSYGMGFQIKKQVESSQWKNITGLLDNVKLVKSVAEQEFMRAAAHAADAGTEAAIAAIHDGALEADVAAECLAAMTRAGSTPPGFGPFLRPAHRMAEEHTSWGDGKHSEAVFLEVAGCVSRYNAPMGRLVNIGHISDEDEEMSKICIDSFNSTLNALKVGAKARDVYQGWQSVVDSAGMISKFFRIEIF